jgi:hypothetical protein
MMIKICKGKKGSKLMFNSIKNKIYEDKIIFKIEDKIDSNIYIELIRCGLKRCDSIIEWLEGKYIASCGEVTQCWMDKDEAICKLALHLQKDRVRYYKELEERGFRK